MSETIADIVREVRKANFQPPWYQEQINFYADRIEAAHKRETEATAARCCQLGRLAGYGASEIKHQQEPVGNVAKMHEALETLVSVIDKYNSGDPLWWHSGAKGVKPLKDARAALSAPPRNCDVGTADDQLTRFSDYCIAQHTMPVPAAFVRCDCPNAAIGCVRCLFAWMHLPYEEGGAK